MALIDEMLHELEQKAQTTRRVHRHLSVNGGARMSRRRKQSIVSDLLYTVPMNQ